MRGSELLDKLNLVSPTFIEAADQCTGSGTRRQKLLAFTKRQTWSVLAACAAVLLISSALFWPTQKESTVLLGGVERNYKELNILVTSMSYDWPWDSLSLAEQYGRLTYNGQIYQRRRIISDSLLGETLGTYTAAGTDTRTEQEHTKDVAVYPILGIDTDCMVAVALDDTFYVFEREGYHPPATWGELINAYNLTETLPFHTFTIHNGPETQGPYALDDDDFIWQVLLTCKESAFVEEEIWSFEHANYLSFTVTSEALGVYKQVFYITADGYLSTNVWGYGYAFDIGEEAAVQMIDYALEHSSEIAPEPYNPSLTGTITEIGDGYLLVDDSILCANAKDGITFTVPTEDICVRRYLDMVALEVGDIVNVNFEGEIDTNAGNTVNGVISIAKGTLKNDGSILID